MNNKLSTNDYIKIGKKKKVMVSDIIPIKGEIFRYIKEGYQFEDEVLERAGIIKKISNERTETVVVNHKEIKEKKYPKETESLRNILRSLNTIDNQKLGDQNGEEINVTNEQIEYQFSDED